MLPSRNTQLNPMCVSNTSHAPCGHPCCPPVPSPWSREWAVLCWKSQDVVVLGVSGGQGHVPYCANLPLSTGNLGRCHATSPSQMRPLRCATSVCMMCSSQGTSLQREEGTVWDQVQVFACVRREGLIVRLRMAELIRIPTSWLGRLGRLPSSHVRSNRGLQLGLQVGEGCKLAQAILYPT